jgi:predicted pyridoxine 5'-phosphate oxidase superfamily flavin-nucleotide-binding protein
VLATTDGNGRVDISPKGGPAGFVAVLDDNHLGVWSDVAMGGNA